MRILHGFLPMPRAGAAKRQHPRIFTADADISPRIAYGTGTAALPLEILL